jgi:hypothetical protein
MTGVAKFSQVSVFSDLNNITDISFDPRFCDLCGITQEELERDFAPEIEAVLEEKHTDRRSCIAEVKRFYSGYRFSEKPGTFYNPFGLLYRFNEGGKFNPCRFAAGTPTFLITLAEQRKIDILNLEKTSFAFTGLQKFNADNMGALAVLYQSGYLTIVDYDGEFNEYTPGYPNEEVRSTFAGALLEQYVRAPGQGVNALAVKLPKALAEGDVEGATGMLPPFFASIPYGIQLKDEKYYQTVVYLIFRMAGLRCRSGVRIAAGRIDTAVETGKYVYCFEFKLEGTAEKALEQIDSKEYLLPWEGSGKALIKVGARFDYGKRNIGEWKAAPAAS